MANNQGAALRQNKTATVQATNDIPGRDTYTCLRSDFPGIDKAVQAFRAWQNDASDKRDELFKGGKLTDPMGAIALLKELMGERRSFFEAILAAGIEAGVLQPGASLDDVDIITENDAQVEYRVRNAAYDEDADMRADDDGMPPFLPFQPTYLH